MYRGAFGDGAHIITLLDDLLGALAFAGQDAATVDTPRVGALVDVGAGLEYAAFFQSHSGRDGAEAADDYLTADVYGSRDTLPLGAGKLGRWENDALYVISCGINGTVFADHGVGIDDDTGFPGDENGIRPDVNIVANPNVTAEDAAGCENDIIADGDILRGLNSCAVGKHYVLAGESHAAQQLVLGG